MALEDGASEIDEIQVTDADRANYPEMDDATIASELAAEAEINAACDQLGTAMSFDDIVAHTREMHGLPPLDEAQMANIRPGAQIDTAA